MAAKYTIKKIANNQNLVDFAMQEYGCLEGVVQLMQDNPQITSPTQYCDPGTALRVLTTIPALNGTNQAVAKQYASLGTKVVTGSRGITIASYTAGAATIQFEYAGTTDQWTFSLTAAPVSAEIVPASAITGYAYEVDFSQYGSGVNVDSNYNMTTDYTNTVGGYGAGVYQISLQYGTADGRIFAVVYLFLVDGNNTVLASVGINSGEITAIRDASFIPVMVEDAYNCSYPVIDVIAFSGSGSVTIGQCNGSRLTIPVDVLGNDVYLAYSPQIDALFTIHITPSPLFYQQISIH